MNPTPYGVYQNFFSYTLMHTFQEEQKVVHRDLATRNVLVVSQEHVKISDFGLARQRKDEQYYYKCSKPSDLPIYW